MSLADRRFHAGRAKLALLENSSGSAIIEFLDRHRSTFVTRINFISMTQHQHQDHTPKRDKPRKLRVASAVLSDERIVELVYDPDARRTRL
ncbi:MAG: hypothetical protein R3229_18400, partial [Alphaproteobacteria bacterium]|nr:hypothetical protein [Alphaproteobacteria bacterium]